MNTVNIAWIALALLVGVSFIIALYKTGSIRSAIIASLILGKLIATVLGVAGLDRHIAKVTVGSRYGPILSINITAAELLFILFALSLVTTLLAPYIQGLEEEV